MNVVLPLECRGCEKELNNPRVLLCGHSLCLACCECSMSSQGLKCPNCAQVTEVTSVDKLPRNLVLVEMASDRICSQHHRPLDLYCEHQNKLLCVDCIFQVGHRHHQDVLTIKLAYPRLVQRSNKKQIILKQSLNKSQNTLSSLYSQLRNTQSNCNAERDNISLFFQETIKILEQEEHSLLEKQRQNYLIQINQLEKAINKCKHHLSVLKKREIELNELLQFTEFNFLKEVQNKTYLLNDVEQLQQQRVKEYINNVTLKDIAASLTKKINKLGAVKIQLKEGVQSKEGVQLKEGVLNKQRGGRGEVVAGDYNSRQERPPSKGNMIVSRNTIFPVMKSQVNGSMVVSNPRRGQSLGKKTRSNSAASQQGSAKKQKVRNSMVERSGKRQEIESRKMQCQDISRISRLQDCSMSFQSSLTWSVLERSIYIVGGYSDHSNTMEKLSLSNRQHETVAEMQSNRARFGCVLFQNKLYLFGGKRGNQRLADCQVYDFAIKEWKVLPPLTKKRSSFGTALVRDEFYLIGGNSEDRPLNEVDSYNLRSGVWTKRRSMIEAREELAVAVTHDGCIYVVGGGRGRQALRTAEMYNPETNQWSRIPSMKSGRRALAAAALADGVYAIGGYDGRTELKSVERYDPNNRVWQTVASLQQARCTHCAVAVDGYQQIIVSGGFYEKALDSIECYGVESRKWESFGRMSKPRWMHCAILNEYKQ